ncbi:smad nuclear-interacting protein 1 isoform X2 [Colias croceus]|uniref:smad nuclear-interacting protein 1 isoform X2 n=1 Tax=Colias crocea TaxID=72248 RepID=UPI001E27A946|nr:smad nuclear-interacting protein 1 isoform X2 [Colias croceus]
MKSKRRHHDSSDESEESDVSDKSSSSSDSESDVSSVSDHRHKKKKKRADSSESESDSDDQKRAKKRKHKKKKRKHSKKKRRSESEQHESDDNISISEGEISVKKKRKHKHKHSKRGHGSSEEEEHVSVERRLHSVVKERRADSEEHRPSRTYYQYPPQQDRFDRNRDKYGQSSQYNEYNQRPREYEQYKRNQRYDDQRPDDGYQKRRNEPYVRDDPRGNKYKQYGERGPMRKEFPDEREYHQRRGPPEPPLREREYPEKRERFPEETRSSDRSRDVRRERLGRPEKPIAQEREYSRSPEERYKEKRRVEHKGERGEPDRDRDSYREREDRRREYSRDRHRSNNDARADRGPRERKSRFADTDEKKDYSWGKTEVKKEGSQTGEKEKPNFGLSGKLTADANTVNGVVIKYTEPDDAKQPKRRWRFYPFKGDKALPILYIHRQSSFLIGRDKKVCDIPLEHPSISKQHAALQYRAAPFQRADGTTGRRVRPYVIDLDSANGTFVNNKKIEPRRYVELLERDVVKFGFSQREYVLLHENSKDDAQDDDQDAALPVATTDKIKQEKRAKEEAAADG